ncbi:hypothetical protein M408DRAFT_330606 [Serendipita vermifera MAFF 305830]|uniref:Uncharacterized protein n=1 Tax=Serendipita vermifera MAFF 305830 TaxID=933852 RepID=A0A0C2XB85_SERVB|nr:hypothetical protein M408DRAFT_330606 [Serendipita vermifera MAFF 305830]
MYLKELHSQHNKHPWIWTPWDLVRWSIALIYGLIQRVIVLLYKPYPPKSPELPNPYGRIAVIGAGLTGISSAAHAIAHGFDVVIYETNDSVGGIWSHVNSTSGLQLNSMLYRFHPAVLWSRGFPHRDEILKEITRIWKQYQLEPRTRFNTPVTSVRRITSPDSQEETDPAKGGHARWVINDGADGIFDAVIVTVGTCGTPQWVEFEGMPAGFVEKKKAEQKRELEKRASADAPSTDKPTFSTEVPSSSSEEGEGNNSEDKAEKDQNTYQGPILHSSQLDSADASQLEGKTVVVIGSGASGVEAVETALARGADKCIMVARDDKWIIPRNMFIDVLIAMQPFGRQMPLSFLWEYFLRLWQYHGIEDLVPAHRGLFEGTPVVNDEFLYHVRAGRCSYIRGDTLRLTSRGALVNVRSRESRPKDPGEKQEIEGDVVVLATGFEKPDIDFLPEDLFPEQYDRPNLYLQNFSTEDWTILLTNSAYQNAIGTVYQHHFTIDTRILLTLLLDEGARPTPHDMKLWVDVVRFLKRGAKGGAFSFFTYMELTIWVILFHILRPDRLRWLPFIMFGWGVHPRKK